MQLTKGLIKADMIAAKQAVEYYAESLNIPFIVPDYIRKNSDIISDWEAGSRYDVAFSIRIDTLKKVQLLCNLFENKKALKRTIRKSSLRIE